MAGSDDADVAQRFADGYTACVPHQQGGCGNWQDQRNGQLRCQHPPWHAVAIERKVQHVGPELGGAERLSAVLERVRAALGEPAPPAFERFGEANERGPDQRLFVRSGRAIVPVAVAGVSRFEAIGDYVAVHAASGLQLLHLSLNKLEVRLDPRCFVRIHRAHIVNLDQVKAFRRHDTVSLVAELLDGTVLSVSRSRARALRHLAS